MRYSTRMGMVLPLLVAIFGCGEKANSYSDSGRAGSTSETALKIYVDSQLKEVWRIARENRLEVASEYKQLFEAAEAGDWNLVTNAFKQAQAKITQEGGGRDPLIANALWVPTMELWDAVGQFLLWSPELMDKYALDVMENLSSNAIYFGGTSASLAILKIYVAASKKPFYVINQAALADNNYTAYVLEDSRNAGIWLPTAKDSKQAFQKYLEDVKSGRIKTRGNERDADWKVQVHRVTDIMLINGNIAKQIFDHNKDSHDFFVGVGESYALPWMYPYLEPCGPIMKLNKEPLPITSEIIAKDQEYWNGCIATLLANPAFKRDLAAQRAFSSLRSKIAGLYMERQKLSEAERAFRQSIELYSDNQEANLRLAHLLAQLSRNGEAVELLEKFIENNPNDLGRRSAKSLLKQIKNNEITPMPSLAPLAPTKSSDGDSLEKIEKAFERHKKAAEQGSAQAQYVLACDYRLGKGTPVDYEAAIEWSIKAAKQGYAPAISSVGNMYERGNGVPVDSAKAFKYYLEAAKQGYSTALDNVGRCYHKGLGTDKNMVKAYGFTKLSTLERAQARLAGIRKEMTPEQVEAGDKLVEKLKEAIAINKAKRLEIQ